MPANTLKRAPASKIAAQLKPLIAAALIIDESLIDPSADFADDLGADSLGFIECLMAAEEFFDLPEITEDQADRIKTFGDLVSFVEEAYATKKGDRHAAAAN
jgi:acyl carrier protein